MSWAFEIVDTSSFDLKVYVAFHISQLPDIEDSREICPAHVMQVTPSRSWVPLCCDKHDAVIRCLWVYEEMQNHVRSGLPVADLSVISVVVIEIKFTAFGASYFLMNETLTTRDMKRYRFHGTTPFRSVSHNGQVLLQVSDLHEFHAVSIATTA